MHSTRISLRHGQSTREFELPAEFVAGYSLGPELGRGAMGVVMQGEQLSTGRSVAIKFMLCPDDDVRARFLRECRVLTALRHPNVLWLIDAGTIGEHPYLVTELVEGGTLRERLEREGRLDPRDAARVLAEVLDGLAACHAAGIVHRDVKPENILFTRNGEAKLADLGIARDGQGTRLTETGVMMGTPAYMAPEQLTDAQVGPAADLYAAGLVGYEMLAGARPFQGRSLVDLFEQQLRATPAPLEHGSEALRAILHAALEKAPEKRPKSAEAMADAVRLSVASARRAAPAAPVAASRRPPLARVALAAAVLVGGGAASHFAKTPQVIERRASENGRYAEFTWLVTPGFYGRIDAWNADAPDERWQSPLAINEAGHIPNNWRIDGLKGGTRISYRILMSRTKTSAPWSTPIYTFATKPAVEITNVWVDARATSAVLHCETNIPANAYISLNPDPRPEKVRYGVVAQATTKHALQVEFLSPETEYAYEISASHPGGTAVGVAGYSGRKTFRTAKN